MSKIALIVGASGLVGKALTKELLKSKNYSKIILIVRNKLGYESTVIEERSIDFDQLERENLKADHVFCCLGTTIKKAGSKAQFRKVDYEYPLNIAKRTQEQGATLFAIVTAMGASSSSGVFYNKVKGEIEEALASLQFEHIGIFRPSILIGDRTELRFGESIGQKFAKFFDFLIPAKYKGIQASEVAKAMSDYATNPTKGYTVIENDAMLA